MFFVRGQGAIAGSLVFATILWGANNAGMKLLVQYWPPVFVSALRFLLCGGLLLFLVGRVSLFGSRSTMDGPTRRHLWTRTGAGLAVYVVAFMTAIKFTSPSNVALYLGASPVWALLLEGGREKGSRGRWVAALMAVAGAYVLFYPSLSRGDNRWVGEVLGLFAGALWALFGHLSRALSRRLGSMELTAHSMWRAGILLLPFSLVEVQTVGLEWRWSAMAVFVYSILGPGVFSFALWSNALKHWPTSQVYLFNNLIPLWTVFWTWVAFREPVTPNVGAALVLILGAVAVSQANWQKILGARWFPPD